MNLQDYIASENTKIIDAMNTINKAGKGIIFVCDGMYLKGVVTDGNIRRYILNNGDLNDCIKKVANYSPQYIMQNQEINSKKYMKDNHISALPIVNERHEIVSIDFLNFNKVYKNTDLDLPVIIMAGGKGTRLAPFTQVLPKPLIPIGNETITERIIKQFRLFGCDKFDIIVNYKKNLIKAYFQELDKDYSVSFIEEEEFLGTGGGLELLKGKYDSTMIVTNCDILIDEDYGEIVDYHKKNQNILTMICSMKNIEIPYGIVELEKDERMIRLKEKPDFSFMANTGMYIIEPEFLDYIPNNTFIHITEIIEKCAANDENVGIYPISTNAWMDMGQMDELERMLHNFEREDI